MQSLWRATRVLLGLLLRRPIMGVCVIPILPDGKIVLIRRRDSGLWGLPGGLIDWGEDVPTAANRELAEETGLAIAQLGRLVGVYSSPTRDPRFHSICVVLEAHADGSLHVHDPAEVLAVAAFTQEELSKLTLAHDHARQIHDYMKNATVVC